MLPSMDSLDELQRFIQWYDFLALCIFVAGGVAIAVFGTGLSYYRSKVETRVAELKELEAADEQKEIRREAKERYDMLLEKHDQVIDDLAEARAQIPQIGGVLTPDSRPDRVLLGPPATEENLAKLPRGLHPLMIMAANSSIDAAAPKNAVRVFLGDWVTWTTKFPYAVISQGRERGGIEDMLVVDSDDDGNVNLNAKFFDANGTILCEVVKNRFERNPNNTWRIELDPADNPHRFTLQDDQGRMVVQVDYINETSIRILGDFYLRRGFRMTFADNLQQIGKFYLPGPGRFGATAGPHPVGILIDPPLGESHVAALSISSAEWLDMNMPESDPSKQIVAVENAKVTLNLNTGIGKAIYDVRAIEQVSDVIKVTNVSPTEYPLPKGFTFNNTFQPPPPGTIQKAGQIIPVATKFTVPPETLKALSSRKSAIWLLVDVFYSDARGQRFRAQFTGLVIGDKRLPANGKFQPLEGKRPVEPMKALFQIPVKITGF